MAGMKICKHCGQEIAKGAKICPHCGGKNSNNTGLIVLGVICLIGIGGAVSNSRSSSTSSSESSVRSSSSSTNTGTNTNPGTNTNKTKSASLTKSDLYQSLANVAENVPFTLSSKSKSFIKEHENLFPTTDAAEVSEYVDESIEYKHLAKSISDYDDKIILRYGYVRQIWEETIWEETNSDGNITLTQINLYDSEGNQYYIYYFGKVDIYEGDYVYIAGLPLATSSFKNTDGGSTLCIVVAGSYIEKAEDNAY